MRNIVEKQGPFIKDDNSTFKIMKNLFIALLPIIIFSWYKNGFIPYSKNLVGIKGLFYPLIFILLPAIVGFTIELLYSIIIKKKRKKELLLDIKSSFSIFPGLFLGLILPINTPLEIVVLGSCVATIFGKIVYGGFGNNIFNPALVGRIFIISTYALAITNNGGYLNPYELDSVAGATPLSNAAELITYNELVKPYGSLWDFFIGTIPGSMGETSALLCIIGFIYLVIKKVLKWTIPVIYISTVFLMTFIVSLLNGIGLWYPLFQILSGGLMFGAIFMATDPVTSPVTKEGQIIYGFLLGILTVVFRFLTPYPEGVLTSILTMNMLVFIIDKIGLQIKKSNKTFIVILSIIAIIMCSISFYIGLSLNTTRKSDISIISKESINNKTTYIVKTKGYSSDIKVEIVIEKDKVLEFNVLEQNDSFYQTITNNNYLDTLLKGQYNLNNLDTVTGATITSTALKKALIEVINDYTNGKGFETKEESIPKASDYEVLEKNENDNEVTYVVSQKSFGGKIKLEIVFIDDKISTINILEQNDSYFEIVEDANYLQLIIENQDNLENLDTVAGATISSKSLKKAIINTIEENNNG